MLRGTRESALGIPEALAQIESLEAEVAANMRDVAFLCAKRAGQQHAMAQRDAETLDLLMVTTEAMTAAVDNIQQYIALFASHPLMRCRAMPAYDH